MESHLDSDSPRRREFQKQFLDRLKKKADTIREAEGSTITGGAEGEPAIARWASHGIDVCQRPDDELGILRISIGGGPSTPVRLNYCVFRGDRGQCIDLLRKALAALEDGPTS